MIRFSMAGTFKAESYCEKMCILVRRCRMAHFIGRDRPSSSSDPLLDNAVAMLNSLGIDGEREACKTVSHCRRPVLYVWSSRGKYAPYAVPKKLRLPDRTEDLYSVMKKVRLCGDFDVTNLRQRLLRSPSKMEIPHRRRYMRFGSYFCSQDQ